MLPLRSLALLVFCAGAAHAAPVEGVIMQVQGTDELFVNLGTQDGLRPGAVLQIYRRVVLKHPITEKEIEDRFPIGRVKVDEAGRLLSIVRRYADLQRQPVPGDYAVLGQGAAPVAPVAKADCPPATVGPILPSDPPEVTALHQALIAGLGRSPDARVQLLTVYQQRYPNGPHAAAVNETIQGLKAQAQAARSAGEAAAPTLVVRHLPVRKVEAQRPLALAVAARGPKPLQGVRLLARRKGDPRWITVQMAPNGIDHYSAPLPPTLLFEPGEVQYAIEAVHADGQAEAASGTLMKPRVLVVEAIPAGEGPPGPSHASFMARYVDFNTVGEGKDAYFQTEARFRYGVRWRALRSVEVGVGLISGDGGTVADLADGLPSEPTSLGYAFAAFELGLSELVGVGARLISGNRRVSDDTRSKSSVGTQLHLRIGEEDGMRFIGGLSAISDLGSRYFGEFHLQITDRLPFTALIEATNLPVSADYGARGMGTLGWRATDWLTLNGEVGLNVRTIKHYGYTLGGGLSFDWE